MIHIIWGKIKNNPWLITCLFIGNILLIATASSIPMYSSAIMQRIFIRELESVQLQTGKYPGLITMRICSTGSVGVDRFDEIMRIGNAAEIEVANDFGVPVLDSIFIMCSTTVRMTPADGRDNEIRGFLYASTGFQNYMEIIAGEPFSPAVTGNVIEAVVSEAAYNSLDLLIGEVYETSGILNADGEPYKFKITGVYAAPKSGDIYWSTHPSALTRHLVIDAEIFREILLTRDMLNRIDYTSWETALDYHSYKAANLGEITAAIEKYSRFGHERYYTYKDNISPVIMGFGQKSVSLNITLWVLIAPIFVLLFFFISMVARQILALSQNEIAVIKSRGGTRVQILLIYLGLSMITAVTALVAGVPLGMAVCGILGASNGFLEFVGRTGLRLEVTTEALLLAAGTAAFSVTAMVIPAVKYARETIVGHKRRTAAKPLWKKAFLDIILLGFALYELYSFTNQKDYIAQSLTDGASLDPLLFISSSMFMLGAGLLFIRLFSYIVRLIYLLGKKIWPPSLYASFLKVMRSSGEEQFIMAFLALTLATGVFNAHIARTINLNTEHALRYTGGADITLMEDWRVNPKLSVAEIDDSGDVSYKEVVYHEPDYSRYTAMPEAKSVTQVYVTLKGEASGVARNTSIQVMGIISDEFGRTAWLRDGLLPAHFYDYLNVLAQNPEALIVSAHFREQFGVQLGDRLNYAADGKNFSGVVCGFADYWPGYEPVFEDTDYNGVITQNPRLLIVANLHEMQRRNGIMPYQVWIKTQNGDTGFIYGEAEKSGLLYKEFSDIEAALAAAKNDPVFQGTNGVLTVGFVVILTVCMAGFLIYWILSIRSRELQFGIFRAMGLGMGSVITMLAAEQTLISGSAILAGVGIGTLTSSLFVPLIQMGYSPGSTLPLTVANDPGDTVRLFVITGIMLAVCMPVLGATVKNIRIAQALKLGED